MVKKILVMGLPGTGKTTLSIELSKELDCPHFESDVIRKIWKDSSFSEYSRLIQAERMSKLCESTKKEYAIADFVCPLEKTRYIFDADFTIWMDTDNKDHEQYPDTNKIFQPPVDNIDWIIRIKDAKNMAPNIVNSIIKKYYYEWNNKETTAFMLGRYQPFHDGHKALFESMLTRSPQVLIAVRDTQGIKNDFLSYEEIKANINEKLKKYRGKFKIIDISNIEHIFYGREVGYNIERIYLDDSIESISATKIREEIKRGKNNIS